MFSTIPPYKPFQPACAAPIIFFSKSPKSIGAQSAVSIPKHMPSFDVTIESPSISSGSILSVILITSEECICLRVMRSEVFIPIKFDTSALLELIFDIVSKLLYLQFKLLNSLIETPPVLLKKPCLKFSITFDVKYSVTYVLTLLMAKNFYS